MNLNNKSKLDFTKAFRDEIFGEVSEATAIKRKKAKIKWILYHTFLSILSILSIYFLIGDATDKLSIFSAPFYQIDISILVIFTISYIVEFTHSYNKFRYFKNNLLILLSIIPLLFIGFNNDIISQCFLLLQIFSIMQVFKLLKFIALVTFLKNKELAISRLLKTNGFIYILYITLALIITCSIALSIVEKYSLWDSIWLSFVTCATVGYGDIIPMTTIGRIISIILMMTGVGLISTLTSTLITYFSNHNRVNSNLISHKEYIELTKQANKLSINQIETLTSIAKLMENDNVCISVKMKSDK